jgi:hypothetical protein
MALMHSERTQGDYGMTITDVKGNKMSIDIPEEQGGTGKGCGQCKRYWQLYAVCSSADVVSILKKTAPGFENVDH